MVAPSTGRCNGGAGKIGDPCGVYYFMTPRGCEPIVTAPQGCAERW